VFWSTAGSTILSVLQRTIQSLGRSKKVASGGPDDILPDYPRHQSVLVQLTLSGSSKDLASHNGGVQYHGELMEERNLGGGFSSNTLALLHGVSSVHDIVKSSSFRISLPVGAADTADNKCVTGDDNNCGARKSSATSLLQQVESISVDRPYSKFSFVELEAATASFSPSKLSIDLK
jgi:hypothetical protein